MPLEIRELVIKAAVEQSGAQGANTGGAAKGSTSVPSAGEDIIKECVDKVLAILKEKNER